MVTIRLSLGYIYQLQDSIRFLTLRFDNLPDKYVILASGLGEISLRHSVLVPLIEDNKCCGVIEIASVDKLPDYKNGFIEKIAESIASVITIMKISERINRVPDQKENTR